MLMRYLDTAHPANWLVMAHPPNAAHVPMDSAPMLRPAVHDRQTLCSMHSHLQRILCVLSRVALCCDTLPERVIQACGISAVPHHGHHLAALRRHGAAHPWLHAACCGPAGVHLWHLTFPFRMWQQLQACYSGDEMAQQGATLHERLLQQPCMDASCSSEGKDHHTTQNVTAMDSVPQERGHVHSACSSVHAPLMDFPERSMGFQ
jgi:hypothetical protein